MENQAANTREKHDDDDDDDDVGSDRISELPESVLLHILCFLSHKKAVQTCVLSKSWRHLGPTRPVIHLRGTCGYSQCQAKAINDVCENCFNRNKEAFVSVLDSTFQRYHEQNLFIQEIRLDMFRVVDLQSMSVLEKWIPIIFIKPNARVNAFHISFGQYWSKFDLPSVVFKVESPRELYLEGCRVKGIDSIDKLMLKNLQKLSLSKVVISDEALEKVISSCPLVKRIAISDCFGFSTISIGNKNPCLNSFDISCCYGDQNGTSIAINAPTLESISICNGRSNWYPNNSSYFPHLKSLFLSQVDLSAELFHNFSFNFPRLQELMLINCSGFEEIELSSCSIKRLIIHGSRSSFKSMAIEVPNILFFEFSNVFSPITLSLATTSSGWKSHLNLHDCLYDYENDVLPKILKLLGLVKAVSQSKISLTLSETSDFKINQIEQWDFNDHPVVVEHLYLNIGELCHYSRTYLLNVLLRIFRPRYMAEKSENCYKEVTMFLWKTLIYERENTEYGWEQHLEEVSIEASDDKGIVWHHEWAENQKFRFRLKWRDHLVY